MAQLHEHFGTVLLHGSMTCWERMVRTGSFSWPCHQHLYMVKLQPEETVCWRMEGSTTGLFTFSWLEIFVASAGERGSGGNLWSDHVLDLLMLLWSGMLDCLHFMCLLRDGLKCPICHFGVFCASWSRFLIRDVQWEIWKLRWSEITSDFLKFCFTFTWRYCGIQLSLLCICIARWDCCLWVLGCTRMYHERLGLP